MERNKRLGIGTLLCILLASTISHAGRTLYVDDDGPGDPGPYTAEVSDPFEDGAAGHPFDTIQEALNAANEGDEIVVARGVYTENITLLGRDVNLHSADPNNPYVVAATVIDGGGTGSVVTLSGTEGAACILRGLTLRHGLATRGAGINGNGAMATICDNVIRDNTTTASSIPGKDGYGGGLYACDGLIEDNTIIGNYAMTGGGLASCHGTIRNNRVDRNTAEYLGGGLEDCSGLIERNTISKNATTGHGAGLVHCDGTIRNNVIVANSVFFGTGGGLHDCDAVIENNTICDNRAWAGGGGLSHCTGTVVNCIVWQNWPDQIHEAPTVRYSSIQGGLPGEGNIQTTPDFVAPSHWDPNETPDDRFDDFWIEGDYHLASEAWRQDPETQAWVQNHGTSPCIDAGDPNSPVGDEPFPHGSRINLGAYGGTDQASPSHFGAAGYGGGNGSLSRPFVIYAPGHLATLTVSPNQWGKHFILYDHLDVAACPNDIGPLGAEGRPFTGSLDGNGKTIAGLTIVSGQTKNVGLFGYLGPHGRVKDLRLVAPYIDARHAHYVGSLVGFLTGELHNCHAEEATVIASWSAGGLVGENGVTFHGGSIHEGSLVQCSTAGAVSAMHIVGGLAGNNNGIIADCLSDAEVSASTRYPAYSFAGGLVGRNGRTIRDSYAAGTVTAVRGPGGLVGTNLAYIERCYAATTILGTASPGGLVGNDSGMGYVYTSYWDMEASGCPSSLGGIGKTTAEMQRAASFVGWQAPTAWTLAEGAAYPRLAWENTPGAELIGPAPLTSLAGTGAADDPYIISSAEDLNRLGAFPCQWDRHYRLAADLDLSPLSGTTFNCIGNPRTPFTGTFDGAGHVIRNFHYASEHRDNVGLFSLVDAATAVIQNLTMLNPSVEGNRFVGALVGDLRQGHLTNCTVKDVLIFGASHVGGLAGSTSGQVNECSAQGDVVALLHQVGVLAGRNLGTLQRCSARGIACGLGWIDGSERITSRHTGGLVGYNSAVISDCYAICATSGESFVGGLVGQNYHGSITDSYCSGLVSGTAHTGGLCGINEEGDITTCFWDRETAQRFWSAGGTDRTTSEMQQATTFLEAGWDFVDETTNGTEDIWMIAEGFDYPRLAWESTQ